MFKKLVKNKAYFSRYQVKYRRRRAGKTDYRARRTMIQQAKTKYGAPKYRLVVRITNKDVVAQFVSAEVVGDKTLCSAYSHELKAFGLNHGLTNYAAAYATGLLLARRTLTKLKIADKFAGAKEATGEYSAPAEKADHDKEKSRFPFRAILDVGLARTTTGARVFGAMKGVVDGGILVPHKPNRFPGFKKGKFDAKVLRERIFGAHVGKYMKVIDDQKKANPDFKTNMFSKFGAAHKAGDLEKLYKSVHEAIRKDPTKRLPKGTGAKGRKNYAKKALTHPERRKAVEKKIASLRKKLKA